VSTNIVRLVRHDGWYISVGTRGNEKNGKISKVVVMGPANDRETDDAEKHVVDYDGTANMVFVADVAGEPHVESRKHIGRCDEALRFHGAEVETCF